MPKKRIGKTTKKCWILESRRKGTTKFSNAGPYIFPRKDDFGSIPKLRRSFPELDLRLKKVRCPTKVKSRR